MACCAVRSVAVARRLQSWAPLGGRFAQQAVVPGGEAGRRCSSSSARWLRRQGQDAFVRQREKENLRSRAAFKLREIAKEHRLLRRGIRIVDLGASPGGWTQEAARALFPHKDAQLVAVDRLPMDPLPEVDFIRGDFSKAEVQAAITEVMDHQRVHGVLSDMAPSFSGDADLDQMRQAQLCRSVLAFAAPALTAKGWLLMKAMHGGELQAVVGEARALFQDVRLVKPKSSRSESREVYVLARRRRLGDEK